MDVNVVLMIVMLLAGLAIVTHIENRIGDRDRAHADARSGNAQPHMRFFGFH